MELMLTVEPLKLNVLSGADMVSCRQRAVVGAPLLRARGVPAAAGASLSALEARTACMMRAAPGGWAPSPPRRPRRCASQGTRITAGPACLTAGPACLTAGPACLTQAVARSVDARYSHAHTHHELLHLVERHAGRSLRLLARCHHERPAHKLPDGGRRLVDRGTDVVACATAQHGTAQRTHVTQGWHTASDECLRGGGVQCQQSFSRGRAPVVRDAGLCLNRSCDVRVCPSAPTWRMKNCSPSRSPGTWVTSRCTSPARARV